MSELDLSFVNTPPDETYVHSHVSNLRYLGFKFTVHSVVKPYDNCIVEEWRAEETPGVRAVKFSLEKEYLPNDRLPFTLIKTHVEDAGKRNGVTWRQCEIFETRGLERKFQCNSELHIHAAFYQGRSVVVKSEVQVDASGNHVALGIEIDGLNYPIIINTFPTLTRGNYSSALRDYYRLDDELHKFCDEERMTYQLYRTDTELTLFLYPSGEQGLAITLQLPQIRYIKNMFFSHLRKYSYDGRELLLFAPTIETVS